MYDSSYTVTLTDNTKYHSDERKMRMLAHGILIELTNMTSVFIPMHRVKEVMGGRSAVEAFVQGIPVEHLPLIRPTSD